MFNAPGPIRDLIPNDLMKIAGAVVAVLTLVLAVLGIGAAGSSGSSFGSSSDSGTVVSSVTPEPEPTTTPAPTVTEEPVPSETEEPVSTQTTERIPLVLYAPDGLRISVENSGDSHYFYVGIFHNDNIVYGNYRDILLDGVPKLDRIDWADYLVPKTNPEISFSAKFVRADNGEETLISFVVPNEAGYLKEGAELP